MNQRRQGQVHKCSWSLLTLYFDRMSAFTKSFQKIDMLVIPNDTYMPWIYIVAGRI